MAAKSVVLAFFKDEVAADDAAESLKAWYKANGDVKMSAIGVLALDEKGKLKTHKLGKRSVGKGAGIGLLLAVIAPPTLLAGVIGGGLLGAFHHKGLGLKGEDRDRIAAQLAGGKAAVGVLASESEAPAVIRQARRARRDPGGLHGYRGGRRRGRGGRPGRRGGRGRRRRRPDDHRRHRPGDLRRAARGRRHDVRPARSDGTRGHRGAAGQGERAAHRGAPRRLVATPGQARLRGRLGRTTALHRVDQGGHGLNRCRPIGRPTYTSTPPVNRGWGRRIPSLHRPCRRTPRRTGRMTSEIYAFVEACSRGPSGEPADG